MSYHKKFKIQKLLTAMLCYITACNQTQSDISQLTRVGLVHGGTGSPSSPSPS